MTTASRYITSTLGADGMLTVELAEMILPDPTGFQVLLKIEAAPINPSDTGLMFGPADLENAQYSAGKLVAPMPEAAMVALAGRVGQAMPIGGECAGTVIAAGDEAAAQALIGQQVSCLPGGSFAEYRLADARACMPLPDGAPLEMAAASFVNPMTVLGFVGTMRREGFTGIIHTAAASNLGQMLVKLCAEEDIPLVNIVRKPAQLVLLKGLGAQHVVDSSQPDFMERLVEAIDATGARIAFDAIGGGGMAGQILTAMEKVCARDLAYSRYGSNEKKQVYVYGTLDQGPTIIHRTFGFTWNVSGWLVSNYLATLPPEGMGEMRERVAQGLTTVFASRFGTRVGLDTMLTREMAMAINAKSTGAKYLITPHG